jgi:membrane protease subunit HflK
MDDANNLHADDLIQASGNEGPPDLEDLFKKFLRPKANKKNSSKNNNKGPGNAGGGGNGGGSIWGKRKSNDISPKSLKIMFLILVLGLFLIWILSGIFIVKPAERAAILRFGRYVETVGPGPHWVPQFIETINQVNVDQVGSVQLNSLMLTQEENIVSVQFVAQYRISNLEDYLFNVVNPVDTLGQSLDSAVRQVIGHSVLNDILTTGRAAIADKVRVQLQALMAQYKTGIEVVDVTMQPATAPEPVKDAFDDVIKAREDKVRSSNEAMSYANQVLPMANGHANQMLQLAKANASQSENNAKADVAAFEALLPQYQAAPSLTENRLYFESIEKVLSRNQVIVASDTGKNMIYISPGLTGLTGLPNGSANTASSSSSLISPQSSAGSNGTPTPLSSGSVFGSSDGVFPSSGLSPDQASYLRWKQVQTSNSEGQSSN